MPGCGFNFRHTGHAVFIVGNDSITFDFTVFVKNRVREEEGATQQIGNTNLLKFGAARNSRENSKLLEILRNRIVLPD